MAVGGSYISGAHSGFQPVIGPGHGAEPARRFSRSRGSSGRLFDVFHRPAPPGVRRAGRGRLLGPHRDALPVQIPPWRADSVKRWEASLRHAGSSHAARARTRAMRNSSRSTTRCRPRSMPLPHASRTPCPFRHRWSGHHPAGRPQPGDRFVAAEHQDQSRPANPHSCSQGWLDGRGHYRPGDR